MAPSQVAVAEVSVESGLTFIGVGVLVLLYRIFLAGLWADETMDGVEEYSVEWARRVGRQVPARFLRRHGRPAGLALIAVGCALVALSLFTG